MGLEMRGDSISPQNLIHINDNPVIQQRKQIVATILIHIISSEKTSYTSFWLALFRHTFNRCELLCNFVIT